MRATTVLLTYFVAAVLAGALLLWTYRSMAGDSRGVNHVVDVNIADVVELSLLPGIGPKMAGRIIADRTHYGRFGNAQALRRVSGIGARTLERITPWVVFGDRIAAPATQPDAPTLIEEEKGSEPDTDPDD
ncbi:MAG: helix-hairpin-helix domain-containing protein [Planctomycetes bacterium]|nr:helix-hairpin-helix domain-containing protein [Planctomycetota bacterium]